MGFPIDKVPDKVPDRVPDLRTTPLRVKPDVPAKPEDILDDPVQGGVDLINQIHNFNRDCMDEDDALSAKVTGDKSTQKRKKRGTVAKLVATPAERPIPVDVDLSVQPKTVPEPEKRKSRRPAKTKATPVEIPVQLGLTNNTQTDVPAVDHLLKAQQDPTNSLAVRRGPPRKGKRLSVLSDFPGVHTRPRRDRRRPDRFGD